MNVNDSKGNNTSERLGIVTSPYRGNPEPARLALSSEDPKLRSSAILALHRLGKLVPEDLERALADPDPRVRRRAAELAPAYPYVSLTATLSDVEPLVVEMCLWALGEREEASDLQIVIEIARSHPESLVREAAVAAIGAIGDEAGKAAVIEALADKPNVRRRAAVALATFDGEDITNALRTAARDRDWQTRQIAEDLLEITEGSED